MGDRCIPSGIMLHGAGGHMSSWKHSAGPVDVSVDSPLHIEAPCKTEAKSIAFVVVAGEIIQWVDARAESNFIPGFLPFERSRYAAQLVAE